MDSKKTVTVMKYNCYRLFKKFMIYFFHRRVVKKAMMKSKREQELELENKKLKKEIETLKKNIENTEQAIEEQDRTIRRLVEGK